MKCMRTMATLTLLDRLQKFDTFPEPLAPAHREQQQPRTTLTTSLQTGLAGARRADSARRATDLVSQGISAKIVRLLRRVAGVRPT